MDRTRRRTRIPGRAEEAMSTPRREDKVRPPIPFDSMPTPITGTAAAIREEIQKALEVSFRDNGLKNTERTREIHKIAIMEALRRSVPAGVAINDIRVGEDGVVDIALGVTPSHAENFNFDLNFAAEKVEADPIPTFIDDLRRL